MSSSACCVLLSFSLLPICQCEHLLGRLATILLHKALPPECIDQLAGSKMRSKHTNPSCALLAWRHRLYHLKKQQGAAQQ